MRSYWQLSASFIAGFAGAGSWSRGEGHIPACHDFQSQVRERDTPERLEDAPSGNERMHPNHGAGPDGHAGRTLSVIEGLGRGFARG